MMNIPNVPQTLQTTLCYGSVPPAPPMPPTPTAPSIMVPLPVSYQFQVVEYMDGDVVAKVELQVQQTTHDQYGNIKMSSGYIPVPRIKLPLPE